MFLDECLVGSELGGEVLANLRGFVGKEDLSLDGGIGNAEYELVTVVRHGHEFTGDAREPKPQIVVFDHHRCWFDYLRFRLLVARSDQQ